MSCVFLSNLNLQHLIGLGKTADKRRDRLSDLEIHWAVLDLQDYIVMILSIKLLEIVVAGSCSVCLGIAPVLCTIVDKASPDDDSAVWCNNIAQHICAVSLSSAVGKRSRSSL